ncbi:hypothetical protein JVT61DRAFT_7842 [Boletus reticuloceps]|uniref:Uncharacterized protein n=1 Tax=Boletus reticuloceps TaxID=495285 RepID=A0A8I3A5G6_9AGAM|nr:hypothetical protein JVT61DRAFT_7842 [Boletus reticuloceps]
MFHLNTITLHVPNTEYNPKRFAAVIIHICEPKTTALIFTSDNPAPSIYSLLLSLPPFLPHFQHLSSSLHTSCSTPFFHLILSPFTSPSSSSSSFSLHCVPLIADPTCSHCLSALITIPSLPLCPFYFPYFPLSMFLPNHPVLFLYLQFPIFLPSHPLQSISSQTNCILPVTT